MIYTHQLSLGKALSAMESFEVRTLTDKTILISVDEIINPSSSIVKHGEGMPILGSDGQRGELIIKFDIQFPKSLSEAEKDELETVLIE